MKFLLCLLLTTSSFAYAASKPKPVVGPKIVTGSVAAFSASYVLIQTKDKLLEFPRRRIMGHPKLKQGAIIQIKLD